MYIYKWVYGDRERQQIARWEDRQIDKLINKLVVKMNDKRIE